MTLIDQIAMDVAARIKKADDDAANAAAAFVAGRFEEYFTKKTNEIFDEMEELDEQSDSSGGDGGEGG